MNLHQDPLDLHQDYIMDKFFEQRVLYDDKKIRFEKIKLISIVKDY